MKIITEKQLEGIRKIMIEKDIFILRSMNEIRRALNLLRVAQDNVDFLLGIPEKVERITRQEMILNIEEQL